MAVEYWPFLIIIFCRLDFVLCYTGEQAGGEDAQKKKKKKKKGGGLHAFYAYSDLQFFPQKDVLNYQLSVCLNHVWAVSFILIWIGMMSYNI